MADDASREEDVAFLKENDRLQEALRLSFGHQAFLPGQAEVVQRILSGEELCVVMPTGAGKSLCYQLPVMMREGYGLVISPLIALMKDQVDGLRARGIPAASVNSAVPRQEQNQAIRDVLTGKLKFLYVAPERFRVEAFRVFLANHPPNLVIVDEAHCISQWGHDFRPDYQRMWSMTPELNACQVCAFTATATPAVRDDIKKQIGRPAMSDLVTGFKRPNLSFQVVNCLHQAEKKIVLEQRLRKQVPTIIYVSTRKAAEALAGEYGLKMYHAGMHDQQRKEAQEYFLHADCPVLVATNAFGMGIDRPDIRQVIHYNIPGSLEAYYQEAGRAGRDGNPAECILIDCYADRRIQEFLLEVNNPPLDVLKDVHRLLLKDMQPDGAVVWMPTLLMPFVDNAKNVAQLNAAARLLERQGILEREFAPVSDIGELKFLQPAAFLLRQNESQNTQRSVFVYRVCSMVAQQGRRTFQGTLQELAVISGLRLEQVSHVLEALAGTVLSWQVGDAEGVLKLSEKGRTPNVVLDEYALNRKKEMDYRRFDDVQQYIRTRGCRQNAIISYFGEKIGDWQCGCCDHCAQMNGYGRKTRAEERVCARRILQAISVVDGQFGRKRIINMLLGEKDDHRDLAEHPLHGSMRNAGRIQLEILEKALETAGFIRTTGGDYPCLELSEQGLDACGGTLDDFDTLRVLDSPKTRSRKKAR